MISLIMFHTLEVVTKKRGKLAGDADTREADGDVEGGEMHNVMAEEDGSGLAEDLDSGNSNEEEGEENGGRCLFLVHGIMTC